MPTITNLNVNQNLGQELIGQTGAGQVSGGTPVRPLGLQNQIRTGTWVEGQVLSQNEDGTYSVRLEGFPQELRAKATVPLIAGERFRAVWDASGSVPVLRLSQGELSFLSQIPQKDRGLATALLSRGLPLSDDVLSVIKDAWRRLGMRDNQLSSLVELWARDVPMTAENAALLSEYAALGGDEAAALWGKIRRELRERLKKGEDPVKALQRMKEGNGDAARFLQAHSILMRAPRQDVNPALLAAPFWPLSEGGDATARVFVGRSAEADGQRYWQVGFGFEGSSLGSVGGLVESDGKACNLTLSSDRERTCDLLEARRGEVRAELEGMAMPVQFISISRRQLEAQKDFVSRGLDLTV